MTHAFDDLYEQHLEEAQGSVDLGDATERLFVERWRQLIEAEPAEFAMWLPQVAPQEGLLFDIYDALSRVEPLPERLVAEEFDRLLTLLERGQDDEAITHELMGFSFFDFDRHPQLKQRMLERTMVALRTNHLAVRRFAVGFTLELLGPGTPGLDAELRRMVEQDPDVVVRRKARQVLIDLAEDSGFPPAPGLNSEDREARDESSRAARLSAILAVVALLVLFGAAAAVTFWLAS